MLTRAYSYDLTVNSFGKAFASAKLIVDEEAHGTLNRIVELNKTFTNSIRKRHKKEDSALCKNKKKRCYIDLLHFSTRKHNLVFLSRPNHILTVELRCIFDIFFSF